MGFEFIRAGKKCSPEGIPLLVKNKRMTIEEKFDGSRFGAEIASETIKVLSRNGIDRACNVPYITEELRAMFLDNTILDGEIIHLHEDRKVRWEMARSVMGTKEFNPNIKQAHYCIYDIQMHNGESLKATAYAKRRNILKEYFKDGVVHDYYIVKGQLAMPRAWMLTQEVYNKMWKDIVEDNQGEGVMIKDLSETKYAKSWTKVKKDFTIDAFVVGTEKGKGKYQGMIGSLILAVYTESGNTVEIGKCSGMTDQERRDFTDMAIAGNLKGLVVEVKANEVTKNLKLRHPAFMRVRDDKPQKECFLTQLKEQLK